MIHFCVPLTEDIAVRLHILLIFVFLFAAYECICEDDWSGRNCDEAGPAALIATATLSPAAIIIIICSILFLLSKSIQKLRCPALYMSTL